MLVFLCSTNLIFSQWTQQKSPTNRDLFNIKFFDNQGVIVGDSVILTSNDSGKTWDIQNFNGFLGSCAFQNNKSVWAVGGTYSGRNLVVKSLNSGANWSLVDTSETNSIWESVFFYNNKYGWIGGESITDTTG